MKHLRKGFTIFFAVLVASIALSIGLAIYDLLIRELALSQTVTQSQYAIYAADTGAECALYWDSKFAGAGDTDGSAFATSSATLSGDIASNGLALCNTQDITNNTALNFPWTIVSNTGQATTTFEVSMGNTPASPCVKVEVGKDGNPPATTIISHGYNTCASTGVVRVERTLQSTY